MKLMIGDISYINQRIRMADFCRKQSLPLSPKNASYALTVNTCKTVYNSIKSKVQI